MSRTLSRREQRLSMFVGVIVFIIANYLLIDWAWAAHTRLQDTLRSQKKQLRLAESMAGDVQFWEKRDAWLQAHQPTLANADTAAVQLLDQVKVAAKKHEVILESPAIRVAERQPEHIAISVEVETKSSWQSLIRFLREFQTSEQFLVVESANLRVDAADATQMRGRFRIAQWYAPR